MRFLGFVNGCAYSQNGLANRNEQNYSSTHIHTPTKTHTHTWARSGGDPPPEKNNISLRFASGHGTICGNCGQQTGGRPHQAPAQGTPRRWPSPPKCRQLRRGHRHRRRLSTCGFCLNLPLTCAGEWPREGVKTYKTMAWKPIKKHGVKTKMKNESDK